jgi:phosphoribosylformylglycinamidine synthase PurS subunit
VPNMPWCVDVMVMPKSGVNDPEGEAILGGLHSLGYASVSRVRAGRLLCLEIEAESDADAAAAAEIMADRLLTNPVIETYTIRVVARVAMEATA